MPMGDLLFTSVGVDQFLFASAWRKVRGLLLCVEAHPKNADLFILSFVITLRGDVDKWAGFI